MSDVQKGEILRLTPPGSILFFPGHIMIYLGEEDGNYYVISATGSYKPASAISEEVITFHSVLVNDLNVQRKNGNTWLKSLKSCKILLPNLEE